MITDKQVKNRINGKFAPGCSGNPNGRPRKKGSLIELLEKKLDEEMPRRAGVTYKEAIVQQWLDTLLSKRDKQKIAALKEMLDRLYGKPKESVELSGSSDKPVKIRVVYDNGDENRI